MKTKTTKKDFIAFSKECQKWQKYFGLLDWDIDYIHEKLDGYQGQVTYTLSARKAVIILNTDWGINEASTLQIRKTAFHEVCHLLLSSLSWMSNQMFSDTEVNDKEHQIIRTLENTVFLN